MNIEELRFDERELIPAVVQDAESGEVLTLAYMNRESLMKTLATGETWFWSRRRQELWHKGETSGNTQTVASIHQDCDNDALLVRVKQKGVACHTGEYTCFHRPVDLPSQTPGEGHAGALGEVVGRLARLIHERNIARPEGSYTVKLLAGGVDRILKKVGEESGEVIIAAKNHKHSEIVWESADLLYHLAVLWEAEGVSLSDVARELAGRGKK
jgi:phosphoribosyl-AMP cyclohydrolase / phosphoribosyl-ATP pyrophosphohydrolase